MSGWAHACLAAALAAGAARGATMAEESIAYAETLAKRGWLDLAALVYDDVWAHRDAVKDAAAVAFRMGKLNYDRGAYDESTKAFLAFLGRKPAGDKLSEGLYWTAESYFSNKHYKQALRYFNACIDAVKDDRAPLYVSAKYGAGWCHFELGRYEDAAKSFKLFETKYFYYKLAAQAEIALGQSYEKLKQYDEACAAFKRVADEGPSPELRAEAYLAIGRVRFSQERYGEARVALDFVLSKFPKSKHAPGAMWWKANIFERWGQPQNAIKLYGEIARLYPRTQYGQEAVVKLGQDLAQAKPADAAALGLGEDALYGLAEAAYRKGRMGDAMEAYARLLQQYPNGNRAADAHFHIALGLLEARDYAAARPHLAAIREKFPQSEVAAEALSREALCAYHLQAHADTQKLCEKLLATKLDRATEARTRFLLGECFFQEKDYAKAADAYRRALDLGQIADMEAEAMLRLAFAQYYGKQYAAAAKGFAAFRSKFPSNANAAQALYLEAESHRLAGQTDDAIERFAEYAEQHAEGPSYAPALYQLAFLLERKGERMHAVECYERASRAAAKAKNLAIAAQADERIAWLLYASDQRDKAADAFLDLLRRWPGRKLSAETYNWLGMRLFQAKRFADAKLAFETLLKHWGRDASKARLIEQGYYRLAQCHEKLGEDDARVDTLQALAAAFPKSRLAPEAKLAAADRYMNRREPQRAEPLFRDVANATAGALQAEAMCKLGEALAMQDKHRDAADVLARVAILFDAPKTRQWALSAAVAAGKEYEALGEPARARQLYQSALGLAAAGDVATRLKSEAKARLAPLAAPPAQGDKR